MCYLHDLRPAINIGRVSAADGQQPDNEADFEHPADCIMATPEIKLDEIARFQVSFLLISYCGAWDCAELIIARIVAFDSASGGVSLKVLIWA